MNQTIRERLRREVAIGGAAYVRNVAAAESAVLQGHFNISKILRAAGFAQRVLAMNAARLLQPTVDGEKLFSTILDELALTEGSSWAADDVDEEAARVFLEQSERVRARLRDILQRSQASLAANPDVLEIDVSIVLFGCYHCGYLVEAKRPDECPLCAAPPAEIAFFGPYYNDTPEHLGRLLPAEIVAGLAAAPDELAALLEGVDDALFDAKPTPDEWSAREIVAHMIETDRLFLEITADMRADAAIKPIVFPVSPSLAHEGKGYERWTAAELVEEFRRIRGELLMLVGEFSPEQWSHWGSRPGRITSMLDFGRWVANHDVGHMAQIRRQCGAG